MASARLCRPGGGIVGVELQGPRVGGECIPPALIGAGAVEAPAEEVLIVRLGRCRCRRTWPARAILREKFTLQCLCHGRRDFILYLEHPGLFPVEGRRPKETTVGNADQLCRDPNPLAFSLEATLQVLATLSLWPMSRRSSPLPLNEKEEVRSMTLRFWTWPSAFRMASATPSAR